MFEVTRAGLPQFSQKAIIPLDLLDECRTIYLLHNDDRDIGDRCQGTGQDIDKPLL